MATKTLIVDDIDGSGDAGTVLFTFDGTDYEVDLSKKNRSALQKALQPYIDVARQTSGPARRGPKPSRPSARSARSSGSTVDNSAVRAWAADNGVPVSARGRISAGVVEQYRAAH